MPVRFFIMGNRSSLSCAIFSQGLKEASELLLKKGYIQRPGTATQNTFALDQPNAGAFTVELYAAFHIYDQITYSFVYARISSHLTTLNLCQDIKRFMQENNVLFYIYIAHHDQMDFTHAVASPFDVKVTLPFDVDVKSVDNIVQRLVINGIDLSAVLRVPIDLARIIELYLCNPK